MLRLLVRVFIPCIIVLIGGGAATDEALACSGGGPRPPILSDMVNGAEAIVRGRVIAADITGQTFTLRVNRYLNGYSGPRNIMVSMQSLRSLIYDRERSPSTRCNYTPVIGLQPGEDVILFLSRGLNGAYHLRPSIFMGTDYARFSAEDTTVAVWYTLDDTYTDTRDGDLTRREITQLIRSVTGNAPAAPHDAPDPLAAPLLLTTDSGRHYLVPVDGQPPQEIDAELLQGLRRKKQHCWPPEAPCTAWSPNGLDGRVIGSSDTQTWRLSGANDTDAHAVLISPTGDTLAEWRTSADGVSISAGVISGLGTAGSFADTFPFPNSVHLPIQLSAAPQDWDGLGAWAADGRVLAFVDDRGLWLWDAFTPDAAPELTPYAGVTAVYDFSRTGRYLAVAIDGTRGHIDLVSGEVLPDGVFGLNDRALIVYGGARRILKMLPFREEPLLSSSISGEVRHAEWRDRWGYVTLVCRDERRETCGVYDIAFGYQMYANTEVPYLGHAFDYSEDTGSLAVLQHNETLLIRHGTTGQQREIRLRGVLDSPAASVEWLPSLFYDRYEGMTL